MRGKRKEGKAQKDKSTVYKDPVKHNALTSHILVTRQQWGVPVGQMKDTSVLSFSCGKLTEWLVLYQEQLLTIFSSPVFQDHIHLDDLDDNLEINKIFSNLHCHLWMKQQYECSLLSSEHSHQCRCILIRFETIILREEPEPSLKLATTIRRVYRFWRSIYRSRTWGKLARVCWPDAWKFSQTILDVC